MKKSLPRFSLALLATSFLVVRAAEVVTAAPLAEAIVLTPQGGTEREDLEISRWQERAREAGVKPEVFERLGWALVAKARRTLDAGYYKLAEKTADAMDARFGASAESRLLRGHVMHNLHRFAEAETVARGLVAERGSANDFALLSDAAMEQGKLAVAIEALQQMVNLHPGIEAYSRIAHVRWLKGDLPGAIEMMEAASRAGNPRGSETQAWTLSRISLYHLQAGDASRALVVAEAAVKQAASYPPALLARGRALLALGNKEDAVGALRRAAELNPLPEYHWWLADGLRAAGQADEAVKTETLLLDRGEAADPRTLALFLATRGQKADAAVRFARAEVAARADVFSYDALAWALAANDELDAADVAMHRALAERTQDARLFLHAGEIARRRGRAEEARKHFAAARPMAGTLTPSERALLATRGDAAAFASNR
ncbi:MAG TPA: tetratricopeptide repeat protein [Opitutaceae bacterium]|nr:tetratricopeptide repeat protein [Opitutaceae bacterium]